MVTLKCKICGKKPSPQFTGVLYFSKGKMICPSCKSDLDVEKVSHQTVGISTEVPKELKIETVKKDAEKPTILPEHSQKESDFFI